jgi:hypothetical protein
MDDNKNCIKEINVDILEVDEFSFEADTVTNRTKAMPTSEYIINRYILKVGNPPDLSLNSDFFQGKNINTSGPLSVDKKHNKAKAKDCSYNVVISMKAPTCSISNLSNNKGIIIVLNDNIELYMKQNNKNKTFT